jgi:hypothetical protein
VDGSGDIEFEEAIWHAEETQSGFKSQIFFCLRRMNYLRR